MTASIGDLMAGYGAQHNQEAPGGMEIKSQHINRLSAKNHFVMMGSLVKFTWVTMKLWQCAGCWQEFFLCKYLHGESLIVEAFLNKKRSLREDATMKSKRMFLVFAALTLSFSASNMTYADDQVAQAGYGSDEAVEMTENLTMSQEQCLRSCQVAPDLLNDSCVRRSLNQTR